MRRAAPLSMSSVACEAERESTFGQAQISRPAASYRTIPSRMLVLLTAAISPAGMPAFDIGLADAVAEQPPVARGVERLRARHPGHGRMRPLALADPDLMAEVVEDDRATAPGAEVDGQEVAHQAAVTAAPTARSARLATFTSGCPAISRSTSAASISAP